MTFYHRLFQVDMAAGYHGWTLTPDVPRWQFPARGSNLAKFDDTDPPALAAWAQSRQGDRFVLLAASNPHRDHVVIFDAQGCAQLVAMAAHPVDTFVANRDVTVPLIHVTVDRDGEFSHGELPPGVHFVLVLRDHVEFTAYLPFGLFTDFCDWIARGT
jgi:hypothetical protein